MRHSLHHRAWRLIAFLPPLLIMPLAWSQQPLQVQEQQGNTFISGGFGQEEREQLQAMHDRFNLKLVFALDAGNYLAGIDVRIVDQQGNTLIKARSDGPIFMVNLPSGSYTVVADNVGNEQKRTVSIAGQDMTEVTFTWSPG